MAGGNDSVQKPRRRAYWAGRRAEMVAAALLRLKGYRILARDYRAGVGELDIVARRGQLLAVVEVKRRRDLATALAAVTVRQRRRIARAAEAFVARHQGLAGLAIRFDVIVVLPHRPPKHLMDAWRPEAM
ncbi:MAG: YraN family protein [Alphaproteobacteria bacterium]|jgi:putative endonuclease|nr:YraN family protein [Alphaproteobacteria bacterium]MDP6832025.1 YraN family protein [Alphaproteobacteria bacterium]